MIREQNLFGIKSYIAGILIGVFLLVFATIGLVSNIVDNQTNEYKKYIEVYARVVDYKENSNTYAEIVEYEVDNNKYQLISKVYTETPAKMGTIFRVKYNPSNPAEALFIENIKDTNGYGIGNIIMLLMGTFIIIYCVNGILSVRNFIRGTAMLVTKGDTTYFDQDDNNDIFSTR